jgi:hypothetical protein
MRRHNTILWATAGFAALLLAAALLGRRQRGVVDDDRRASTYLTGPSGASALYEALPALGARVSRMRDRPSRFATPAGAVNPLLLVLSPSQPTTADDVRSLLAHHQRDRGSLLLAGPGAAAPARCLGYAIRSLDGDSARVAGDDTGGARPFHTHAVLAPATPAPADSNSPRATRRIECPPRGTGTTDTLLASARGPVALRIVQPGGHQAILVADVALFRNRQIRETQAGPFVLALLARHDLLVFDEYHQGFGPSGSLLRSLLAWSVRSPLGWAAWHVAVVGVLALLAAAIRFGRPRTISERRRRTSLEHVRALATALAASRGHDVAISLLVRGLRRRLARRRGTLRAPDAGQGAPELAWLATLDGPAMTPEARRAVHILEPLLARGQNEAAVLRAANAVEDVWDSLRQSDQATWRR